MTRPWPLVVRRATRHDEAAVMAFATQTWGGWDYMPRAWSRWIDAPDGVLLVGAVGADGAADADGEALAQDSVVAVVRVALPAAGEAWLEGIRVDPRVRGTDVATDLQVAELHWAAANSAHIVRYATSARNEGSMRLGSRGGFELIVRLSGLSWEPPDHDDSRSGFDMSAQAESQRAHRAVLDQLSSNYAARPERASELWRWLSADPSFNQAQRLYEPRPWALEELTEEKFLGHVRRGEVLVSGSGKQALAILVAEVAPAEETAIRLSPIAGSAGAAWDLARAVRSSAEGPVRFRYAVDAPVVGDAADLYREHGWEFSETPLHIMARPIDDAHPIPVVDPKALTLTDTPSAVITPAQ